MTGPRFPRYLKLAAENGLSPVTLAAADLVLDDSVVAPIDKISREIMYPMG